MDNNSQPSIFGRSLQLVNGDLHFVEDDLAIISDRNNFMQAIQVMIETPFGTDIFNVNYGFDLLNSISQPRTFRLIQELIRLNIVKGLSIDNRIREITEIVFDDDPRFFELNPQEDLAESRRIHKAERRWQAMVVIQTISAGEVAVRLEGVGL
jgi:hypothetical protein